MSRIRIKNFGPIKEGLLENDGWIDIKKVTVFIGNQGSGKSTIAKLISTFSWMEKAFLNGALEEISESNFLDKRLNYFRLLKYMRAETELYYEGEYCNFEYVNKEISSQVKDWHDAYIMPKIMYIPSERSFLSSVEYAENVSGLPLPLFEFMDENNRSLKELDDVLSIPIGDYKLRYDTYKRVCYISGEGYELELKDTSSGLHSAVPLYVVSRNLANGVTNKKNHSSLSNLSYLQEQRRRVELQKIAMEYSSTNQISSEEYKNKEHIIESKYRNSSFLNIVEEPEQNLFPTSQKEILYSLLEFNNKTPGNKLIITTHSPYLINDLTLSIEGNNLLQKIKAAGKEDSLNELVYGIVPKDSTVSGDDVAIYEMDEVSSTISLLGNYKGLPSDENKLNNELGLGNEQFSKLLEIANLCR